MIKNNVYQCEYDDLLERILLQGNDLCINHDFSNGNIHVITDPPYEIGYDDWDRNGIIDWVKFFDLSYDIITDNGNLVIFSGWTNIDRIMMSGKQKFKLQNMITYDRIKGRGAKRNLVSTSEYILWFSKSNEYVFNNGFSNIKKKTGGMGNKNGSEYRRLSNCWTDIPPLVPWGKERNSHPTQKPLKLMQRIIETFTNSGDCVIDPFCGSGTTLIAAKKLNRDFIGGDNNSEYVALSKGLIYDH